MKNPDSTAIPSWLRLAEYGDWPHPRGLQRFTPAAANTMVRYFKSLRGRLNRKFGGLPVYIGHPDDAQFSGQSGHTDTRAYAWVTDLEARSDGLYGAFKWSASGEALLHNAFYKFLSPRWAMQPLGKDTFEPIRLLSVGLTNQPNIPGEAIANSIAVASEVSLHSADSKPDEQATEQAAQIDIGTLRTALGIGEEIDPLEAISELREQSERFYRIACEQSEQLATEATDLANARREHVDLVVQNALLSGRIAPHEAANWRQSFAADADSALAALSAHSHSLKTAAIANTRAPQTAATGGTEDFIARVEAHAKAKAMNFAEAWSDLKRQQPDLFQQFFGGVN